MFKRFVMVLAFGLIFFAWYSFPRYFSSVVNINPKTISSVSVMGATYDSGMELTKLKAIKQLHSFFEKYKYKRDFLTRNPIGPVCSIRFQSGDYIQFYGSKTHIYINRVSYKVDEGLILQLEPFLKDLGFEGVLY